MSDKRREFWICFTQRINSVSSSLRVNEVPDVEKDWYDEIIKVVELKSDEKIFSKGDVIRACRRAFDDVSSYEDAVIDELFASTGEK